MDNVEYQIPIARLQSLKEGRLFYPCAGMDWHEPIELFHNWINEFWFVDTCYNQSLERNSGIKDFTRISLDRSEIDGRTIWSKEKYTIKICHQQFEHSCTGKHINVYHCSGRGYDAFRSLIKLKNKRLSIFYYRGDSSGESGSGFYWLSRSTFKYVLEYIEDGGLVITDGSNSRGWKKLCRFHRQDIPGNIAMEQAESFSFHDRRFECVGYAGKKYGPTLIWRVQQDN